MIAAAGSGGQSAPVGLSGLLGSVNLSTSPAVQAWLQTGGIDPRAVSVLDQALAHYQIGLGSVEVTTDPAHVQELVITSVDGQPVGADNFAARDLVTEIAAMDPSIRPDEIGTPWPIQSPGFFTDPNSANSLRLAFEMPGTNTPAPPATAPTTTAPYGNPPAAGTTPTTPEPTTTPTTTPNPTPTPTAQAASAEVIGGTTAPVAGSFEPAPGQGSGVAAGLTDVVPGQFVTAVSSPLLTSGQATFCAHLASLTGLSPRVVAAWELAEESGQAAQARQAASNYNWLNIGYFDSGPGPIAFNDAFQDPVTAAQQTAQFLEGDWGDASASIRAILDSVGQDAGTQLAAIANSDWASSHYGGGSSLVGAFSELTDMAVETAAQN